MTLEDELPETAFDPAALPSAFPLSLEALWQAVVQDYAQAGMADRCLALQDRYGLDVPLVLVARSVIAKGWRLDAAAWQRVAAGVAPWRSEVILPLRAARQWIKGEGEMPAHPLRDAIKKLEISAEREEIAQLHRLLQHETPKPMHEAAAWSALELALGLPPASLMPLRAIPQA